MKTKKARWIRPIKDRFMEKVEVKRGPSCWIWQGAKNKEGYGSFRVINGGKLAHRACYELFVGEIPIGMLVCHKCDNPSCVNPKHLYLGTNQTNTDDKVKKKRHSYGMRVAVSKLNPELVKTIREEYKTTKTSHRKLAAKYNVSPKCIQDVVSYTQWRHV